MLLQTIEIVSSRARVCGSESIQTMATTAPSVSMNLPLVSMNKGKKRAHEPGILFYFYILFVFIPP